VRKIDTDSVVAVVKGEVAGGEASGGGSSENTLWLFPDASKIKDEPLEVVVPKGLPELTPNLVVPAANPLTKAKFELGRQLYFDPRISKDGTVSCATCHNPEHGWTDQMPVSAGIDGQLGGRSAPSVLNTAYGKTMFWDGRAPSLEGQAQGPIQNPIEMGKQTYDEIIARLRAIPGYHEQFERVFGTDVTLDGIAKAIATFERAAALSGNSAYDRYVVDQDDPEHNKALTESQKRGLVLFGLQLNDDDEFKTDVVRQKAKCSACHVGFNFTDEQFHNLGVGYDAASGKFSDLGRFAVTSVGAKNASDIGSFKTPTLRDLDVTGPYMHDGSEATLEKVVDYYDKGGNPNPYLDKDMKPLNLTAQEKADVVAFLKALNGERKPIELPKLPLGPDGTAPDPRAALETPSKKVAISEVLHTGSRQ
jgi:cytochrome c peroxidase